MRSIEIVCDHMEIRLNATKKSRKKAPEVWHWEQNTDVTKVKITNEQKIRKISCQQMSVFCCCWSLSSFHFSCCLCETSHSLAKDCNCYPYNRLSCHWRLTNSASITGEVKFLSVLQYTKFYNIKYAGLKLRLNIWKGLSKGFYNKKVKKNTFTNNGFHQR